MERTDAVRRSRDTDGISCRNVSLRGLTGHAPGLERGGRSAGVAQHVVKGALRMLYMKRLRDSAQRLGVA